MGKVKGIAVLILFVSSPFLSRRVFSQQNLRLMVELNKDTFFVAEPITIPVKEIVLHLFFILLENMFKFFQVTLVTWGFYG